MGAFELSSFIMLLSFCHSSYHSILDVPVCYHLSAYNKGKFYVAMLGSVRSCKRNKCKINFCWYLLTSAVLLPKLRHVYTELRRTKNNNLNMWLFAVSIGIIWRYLVEKWSVKFTKKSSCTHSMRKGKQRKLARKLNPVYAYFTLSIIYPMHIRIQI